MLNLCFSSGRVLAGACTWACFVTDMFMYSTAIFIGIYTLCHVHDTRSLPTVCPLPCIWTEAGQNGEPSWQGRRWQACRHAAVPVPWKSSKHAAAIACCWPALQRDHLPRRRAPAASALGWALGRGGLCNAAFGNHVLALRLLSTLQSSRHASWICRRLPHTCSVSPQLVSTFYVYIFYMLSYVRRARFVQERKRHRRRSRPQLPSCGRARSLLPRSRCMLVLTRRTRGHQGHGAALARRTRDGTLEPLHAAVPGRWSCTRARNCGRHGRASVEHRRPSARAVRKRTRVRRPSRMPHA
jgi:hypothetical protein